MNQKDAVFEAVKEIRHGAVDKDEPVVLNKQEKELAHQKLFEGFKKGKVAYAHEMPSDDKLLLYVSGLVSNWLRKDRRLNGQTTYRPRNPGARTNPAGDKMRALHTLTGMSENSNSEVEVFVIKRNAESSTVKTEQVEISSLPEELQKYVKQ